MGSPRLVLFGSTRLSEVVAEALLAAGYPVLGYVPSVAPLIRGAMPVPEVPASTERDLALSVQYDRKLPVDGRTYNVHTGLLPAYGGCDILYHTLKQREKFQGLSFHLITEAFDAGPLISRVSYPVLPDDTILDLYQRILVIAPPFVVGCLRLLEVLGSRAAACEAFPPRLYRRGEIDPADRAEYIQMAERLREAFGR